MQNANLLVNYDLQCPPNRIEQRFGRIHRQGAIQVTRIPVLEKCERITFDRDRIHVLGKPPAELMHPGHPLMSTVIDMTLERAQGTVLVDPHAPGTIPICFTTDVYAKLSPKPMAHESAASSLPSVDVERIRARVERDIGSMLQRAPVFDLFARGHTSISTESLRRELLARGLRLTESMAPELYEAARLAASRLGVTTPCEIYQSTAARENAASL